MTNQRIDGMSFPGPGRCPRLGHGRPGNFERAAGSRINRSTDHGSTGSRRARGPASLAPALAAKLAALIVLVAAFPTMGAAQPRTHTYCVESTVTLAASATAVTVQQPATGARNVRGDSATVYASAACAFSIEKNGTAATATALTAWVGRDDIPQTPAADAFGESDVGAGAAGPRHVVPAGGTYPLSLRNVELRGNGTAKNFTLRTESCSADVQINVCWEEF